MRKFSVKEKPYLKVVVERADATDGCVKGEEEPNWEALCGEFRRRLLLCYELILRAAEKGAPLG